jgi:hypothetical protein
MPVDSDRAAPPGILDPILAAWEGFDRRRRRIRPMRRAGILGLEMTRHRGCAVTLGDGTVVRRGDVVGEVHLLNPRLRELETRAGLAAAYREARADLRALAAWSEGRLPERRPVALHGVGITARLASRAGWELRPRARTPWRRVQDWYFRWLLVHWSPAGRERLRHGRGPLSSVDAWLSGRALQARYGPPRAPSGSRSGQAPGSTSGSNPL